MKNESGFRFCAPEAGIVPAQMLTALVQAGYSNTRARRAVLTALCEAGGQASTAELLNLGRGHHADLGLVTVYRTLDILLSLGLVRKLHLDDGCHIFALSLAGKQSVSHSSDAHEYDHGHHVICQGCGRAVEFAGCDLDAFIATVEAQTGFRVRRHWLELFGVCPGCQGERISE